MTLAYYLSVLPFPFCVFLFNLLRFLRGQCRISARTAMAASLPVLFLSLLPLLHDELSPTLLPAAFAVGASLLLNDPAEGESASVSGYVALLLNLSMVPIGFLLRSPARLTPALYGALLCGQAVYSACRLALRRERIRDWVRPESVPDWAEDLRRLSVRYAMLAAALLSQLLPSWGWSAVTGGGFALLALRNWTGRPLLEELRFETLLRELVSVAVRRPIQSRGESVSRDLYERCCMQMDERRPFLVDKFSLADLARSLYTNKAYLSRSINHFSGKNFRQFVNYYRVKYAMEQFAANKHLRVSELAMLSGFRSTVSFNMAFKIVTGETPSDWKRLHLRSARKGGREP